MAVNGTSTDVVWELSEEAWQQIESMLMTQGRRRPSARSPGGQRNNNVVVVKDPYYILAPSPVADENNRVLKQGDTFAVFDRYGDITPTGMGEEGLYHEGTRFLSCLVLRLGEERPLMLSSTVKEDNALLTVDLTNPDVHDHNRVMVPRGTVHIFRSKLLWQGCCFERLRVRNYGRAPVEVSFTLEFLADFADIFEVRGTQRRQRGELLEPVVAESGVVLAYRGLDGAVRRARLEFSPPPKQVTASEIRFDVSLAPKGEATFYLTVTCETDDAESARLSYDKAADLTTGALRAGREQSCVVWTANEQFNDWLNRSAADLDMMLTETKEGLYPYAGVPWFSTAFGRDGIITALQCLWMNPSIARGVLGFLAATQADRVNPAQDAEPGKILHETRRGEMAALGEIPFGRYYGSVDSTPLFVLLAGAYYERTGDRDFIERIWPNVERALEWIDRHGDPDGDGFVEYARHSPTGLVHQGWKDSQDAVFHADGTPAEAPIALCEVQGYVYAAKRRAAELAALLGHAQRAVQLREQAQALQRRFEEAFWCEELSTYALALDGKKRPCRVRTSNAGQVLFTGIAAPDRARRVAHTLLHEDGFSGWGIRTVARSELCYNPMSYHNGSIWPHDNSLIALGLDAYQLKEECLKVLTGLFDASLFVDLHRMPELFCGFIRRPGEGPTLYPVACAPQSWAAAAVFLLLQACLGLHVNGAERRVCFAYPLLPEFLKEVIIGNLRVGDAAVDLRLQRHAKDVGVNVLRRTGNLEVIVVK